MSACAMHIIHCIYVSFSVRFSAAGRAMQRAPGYCYEDSRDEKGYARHYVSLLITQSVISIKKVFISSPAKK